MGEHELQVKVMMYMQESSRFHTRCLKTTKLQAKVMMMYMEENSRLQRRNRLKAIKPEVMLIMMYPCKNSHLMTPVMKERNKTRQAAAPLSWIHSLATT